ncbi:glycoside hydrolase family 5 protein [Zymoseptoria brevis]|uniref:Glycoside hydrolase family 5 protein n=1 Tax=Zymoseptoria brevis TaxID=1047168 RepID=A0A0F4GIB7_9PEZI|nr:glycoside hydrolase family 5 protein [Zymoseptoria brevis]
MSWSGTNLYFLQGLSDDDQDAYIDKLKSYNTKVVRLWVNRQAKGCQKGSTLVKDIPALETTLGQYNNATLDAVDQVLVKLAAKDIKAIISPHDANSLLGGYRKDCYFDRWGPGSWVLLRTARRFRCIRCTSLLHLELQKGSTPARCGRNGLMPLWPSICSYDSSSTVSTTCLTPFQNEPMDSSASNCQNNDPHGWACGCARKLKSLLGDNKNTLVTTGGLGGDISHDCTFNTAVTHCDAIDAIAVHRYASVPGHWSSALPDWISQANGKKVYLEERGIDASKYDQKAAFVSEVEDMNSVGLPSLYWQILPPGEGSCEGYDPKTDKDDHFGIFQDSGTDLAGPMNGATGMQAAQDWTGSVY